jgi:hypothetical protein
MTIQLNLLSLMVALLVIWIAYLVGLMRGSHIQRKQWRAQIMKAESYFFAVDDLDRWCGHVSPHARLIARHIRAHGEGRPINAGTPTGDEPCTIDGLRTQLARLDAHIAKQGGAA